MSQFVSIVGLNPADAKSVLGGDTSGVGSKNDSSVASFMYPLYVPLSRDTMLQIEAHYTQEPLIATANSIKSDKNLGIGGFDIEFAGKTVLDDGKYHHLEACNLLLEHARSSRDMFGFCLVQDASTRLEEEVREMVGDPIRDEDDPDADKYAGPHVSAANSAGSNAMPIIDVEQKLTEMASKYMFRASDALGLSDVRSTLLTHVDRFNNLQRNVDSGLSSTTYPQNGPALPPIVVGSVTDSVLSAEALAEKAAAAAATTAGDGDGENSGGLAAEKMRAARQLKRQGFDYLFTKIRFLRPVNFRDYNLYLRINRLSNERDVVACRRARRDSTVPDAEAALEEATAHRELRLPKSAIVDDTVHIFVWPGLMPSDEGMLRTQMHDAIRKLWKLEDADRRRILADESNVRPTVFLTYEDKVSVGDMRDLSEQELLNLGTQPTAKDSRADRNQTINQYRAGVAIDLINGKRQDELSRAIVAGNVLATGETPMRRLNYPQLGAAAASSEKLVPLPRGFSTGAVVSGKSLDDVAERRAEYKEHIAGMVGIPLIQLLGGMGSSRSGSNASASGGSGGSAAVTGGSAELSGGLFRPTIMKDRTDLAAFLQNVFEIFFRDMSNAELARVLSTSDRERQMVTKKHEVLMATLQEHFTLVTEAAQQLARVRMQTDSQSIKSALIAHFQSISEAAKRVSSMEHRFRLVFKRESFVDYAEIDQLKNDGAITAFQAANMKLSKMCLPQITEEQFEANRRKRLADTKDEVDAKVPTPLPEDGPQPPPAPKKAKK